MQAYMADKQSTPFISPPPQAGRKQSKEGVEEFILSFPK